MGLQDYCIIAFGLFCSSSSVIFCEAVAIYGVIVAIILQTKLESVPALKIYAPESLRAGYAIFASGIIVGFANLVCGLCVGIIGSSCVGCPELHSLCENSGDRNLWECTRFVWSNSRNYHDKQLGLQRKT